MRTVRLFNRYWALPAILSLIVEASILVLATLIASNLRDWLIEGSTVFSAAFVTLQPLRVAVFVIVTILCLYFNDHYQFVRRFGRRQLWIRLAKALTISWAILLVLYYTTGESLKIGRGIFLLATLLSAFLLAAWRELLAWFLRMPVLGSRILIVGADQAGAELAREVLKRDHLGYHIVGFLDDDPALLGTSVVNPKVIGTTAEACRLALEHNATMLVVAMREKRGKLDIDSLLQCKTYGFPVEDGSSFVERLTGRITLENLRKSWLVFSRGFVVDKLTLAVKRTMDIVFAGSLILLTTPFMLLAALAVRLSSPGSILYRQERVGLRGQVFTLLKFRSMIEDAEAPGEARWAEFDDPRITAVGRILRRSRIDELPQLWNVLVGDMSLVGPRPERPAFVETLRQESPFYDQRHEVRPGVTGWAQIMAPYASSVGESLEKLEYDLFYIKNLSFLLDLSILASTAKILLLGRGAR